MNILGVKRTRGPDGAVEIPEPLIVGTLDAQIIECHQTAHFAQLAVDDFSLTNIDATSATVSGAINSGSLAAGVVSSTGLLQGAAVQCNGALNVTGHTTIVTGTISGPVGCTSAITAIDLFANAGVHGGFIVSNTSLTAASATISGAVGTGALTANGTLTATGALTVPSAQVNGALTTTGTVTAPAVQVNGTLTATNNIYGNAVIAPQLTASSQLTIGSYNVPGVLGTSGQVLTSNGANATWQSIPGVAPRITAFWFGQRDIALNPAYFPLLPSPPLLGSLDFAVPSLGAAVRQYLTKTIDISADVLRNTMPASAVTVVFMIQYTYGGVSQEFRFAESALFTWGQAVLNVRCRFIFQETIGIDGLQCVQWMSGSGYCTCGPGQPVPISNSQTPGFTITTDNFTNFRILARVNHTDPGGSVWISQATQEIY